MQKDRIRVLQFIHGLNTGGAETLVKNYVLNMDQNIFEPIVLCLEHIKDSPYEKILEDNHIKVIYICDKIKLYQSKNIFLRALNHIKRKYAVKKVIQNLKPDIVHFHLFLSDYIKFAKLSKKAKIFYTVHSEPSILWDKKIKKKAHDFQVMKWLVKNYKVRFIVLHENMRKEINMLFKVKDSIILNNGVDFSAYTKIKGKKEMRKELKIPQDALVIGHVGRFDYQKNHTFLVKVFKRIYMHNKKAFLLMIGSGPLLNDIEKELNKSNLSDHYIILQNRSDIPDVLSTMDAFVFPSLYEGLGIALIEAQKAKLPCFISDAVPDAAIISNYTNKLPLKDSPEEWAEKILSYKMPEQIILNDKEWDIKEITKKLEKIYLEK